MYIKVANKYFESIAKFKCFAMTITITFKKDLRTDKLGE
jgi:hypothetical protein